VKKYKVVEYIKDGESVFEKWFLTVDASAAARITAALYRMEQGNFSNVKSVGKGVSEYKIDFGPGYRIYFGQSGEELIVPVGGGTKKTQKRDIEKSQVLWSEYKKNRRK
jgi:putative addiction module killer protein